MLASEKNEITLDGAGKGLEVVTAATLPTRNGDFYFDKKGRENE